MKKLITIISYLPPKKPDVTPKKTPRAIANIIEAKPTINDILDP